MAFPAQPEKPRARLVSLEEQIACVEREIGMRERSYPRWVRDHKLLAITAELELTRMRAVLETLHIHQKFLERSFTT